MLRNVFMIYLLDNGITHVFIFGRRQEALEMRRFNATSVRNAR
jgi:hypothetical protein